MSNVTETIEGMLYRSISEYFEGAKKYIMYVHYSKLF